MSRETAIAYAKQELLLARLAFLRNDRAQGYWHLIVAGRYRHTARMETIFDSHC